MSLITTLRDAVEAVNDATLELDGQPVRSTLDPKRLTLPGVWVKLDGLQGGYLCQEPGYGLALVTIYCAVATTDLERSLESTSSLLELVAPIIPVMSDPRLVALVLPAPGTPATALSYQHQLVIQ